MKEECSNCHGQGWTVEPECCGNFYDKETNSLGGCCGMPDPAQVQCNCESHISNNINSFPLAPPAQLFLREGGEINLPHLKEGESYKLVDGYMQIIPKEQEFVDDIGDLF